MHIAFFCVRTRLNTESSFLLSSPTPGAMLQEPELAGDTIPLHNNQGRAIISPACPSVRFDLNSRGDGDLPRVLSLASQLRDKAYQ